MSSRTVPCTTPASPTRNRPKQSRPRHTSTTRHSPCWVRRARRCSRSPTRSAWSPSPRRSPTGPIAPMARWCRGPNRMRCSAIRPRSSPVPLPSPASGTSRRSTARGRSRRPLDLHPWRHPGRGGPGAGGQVGPRARVGRGLRLHGVTMRILPMGPHAVLIEQLDGEPAAWAAGMRRLQLPGVTEIVPGAATVLVVCVDERTLGTVRQRLREVRPAESVAGQEHDPIEIPVRYDGDDLDAVAAATGLTTDDVIGAAHGAAVRGCVLRLRARLRLPPRARPAAPSSAAIDPTDTGAGGIRGDRGRVHSRVSAGLARGLAPAGAHRRGDVRSRSFATGGVRARCTGQVRGRMRASIEVVDAGIATTVQDRGRPGLAHLGIPPAGAVDPAPGGTDEPARGQPDRGRPDRDLWQLRRCGSRRRC